MMVYVAVYYDPSNENYEVGGVFYNHKDATALAEWYNTIYYYNKSYVKLFSIL